MPDRRFGVAGRWSFLRCASCGVVYLSPRPDDLALAYPSSYTQHIEPPSPRLEASGPISRLKTSIRKSVLAASGYRQFASSQAVVMIGRILSMIPPIRLRAFNGFLLLPPPGDGEGRLLDIGCGNGRFLGFAALLGWRTAGIEPDKISADIARRVNGAVVFSSDAALDDASFDAVTMNHVLEHVSEPGQVLSTAYRLLRPGGTLGVCVPNWNALGHLVFRSFWHALEPSRHLTMFDVDTLRALLQKAGFTIDAIHTTSIRDNVPNFTGSWSARFGASPSLAPRLLWSLFVTLVAPLMRLHGEEIVALAHKPAPSGAPFDQAGHEWPRR